MPPAVVKEPGFVFPGLVPEDEAVGLKLFGDAEAAANSTRLALLALYSAEFKKQIKALRKDIAIPRGHWALYEGLGSHEQINDALFHLVLYEVFGIRSGRPHTAAELAERVRSIREKGFAVLCRQVFDTVSLVLEERRTTLDVISRFAAMGKNEGGRFAEYRRQAARIVPADFLQHASLARLAQMPRYLKALRIRVERAHVSPAKDAIKAEQVAIHENRLAEAGKIVHPAPELLALVDELREMIEEFKVSLYAQELGTAFPVSGKRLDKKWQEIKTFC